MSGAASSDFDLSHQDRALRHAKQPLLLHYGSAFALVVIVPRSLPCLPTVKGTRRPPGEGFFASRSAKSVAG